LECESAVTLQRGNNAFWTPDSEQAFQLCELLQDGDELPTERGVQVPVLLLTLDSPNDGQHCQKENGINGEAECKSKKVSKGRIAIRRGQNELLILDLFPLFKWLKA